MGINAILLALCPEAYIGHLIGYGNGELAERSKAHDWKSCMRQKPYLGFKSLALRHSDFFIY